DVVSGPGGEPMCRITRDNPGSADPAIAQCRPLNLFGANNADPAAIGYATTLFAQQFDNYQTSFQFNLGGSLLHLPAGALSFATGYEYRKERSSFGVNEANLLGLGRDRAILPGSGKYDTNEAYAELLLPLAGGAFSAPLIQQLDLEAAGRWTKNSV